MDRRHLKRACRLALVAGLSVVATTASQSRVARAQALDSLHVRSFTLNADTATPQVGESFKLTIKLHVDEQITEVDNVTLPDLSGFDVQGDERGCSATPRGSDCFETIALVPTVAGTVTIASATMDAIDASDKKPSRFGTNSLKLQIGNAPFHLGPGRGYIAELFWSTVRKFFILLAAVIAIWFLLRYLWRPKPAKPVVASVAAAPVIAAVIAPVSDFESQFRALVDALRQEPTRPRALAVRHALRYSLGAQEKETLADLVRRNAAGDRPQRIAALRAIERACSVKTRSSRTTFRRHSRF